MKLVREGMGLTNVILMIPFCRTIGEAKKVAQTMADNGLERGANGLEVYVMCEIPSNVILFDEFAELFDGFSIGSNDLTQLTLGVDRDSTTIADIFDERDGAVMRSLATVVKKGLERGKKIGICGQAPSDYPEMLEFLVREGIGSVSLNPDTALDAISTVGRIEGQMQ
jgi:pyruvate,water dikinase